MHVTELGLTLASLLNRITVMFPDQDEFRAQRRQDIRMGDWEAFLDKFLHETELPMLAGAGRNSKLVEDAFRDCGTAEVLSQPLVVN